MPPTSAPFLLKNISVMLAVAPATEIDYRCFLNQAQLTPSAGGGGGVTYDTFCQTYSSPGSGETWTLDLGGFQAYADVSDLSRLLLASAGELMDYLLVPQGGTISATNPGYQGQVTVVPGPIGGTANTYAVFTVSLPCTAAPTEIVTPPVTGVFAAGFEETKKYGGGGGSEYAASSVAG